MADVPLAAVGFVVVSGVALQTAPHWKGPGVLFGVRIHESQARTRPIRTALWVYRSMVAASCVCAWLGVCGVLVGRAGVYDALVLQLAVVPLVAFSAGRRVASREARRAADHDSTPPPGPNGPDLSPAPAGPSAPGASETDRRLRFIAPYLEAGLWGALAAPVTVAVHSEGWRPSWPAVALVLAATGMQVVGLWVAIAAAQVHPRPQDDRPREWAALAEPYLTSWVRTIYGLRAGTLLSASGVLWVWEIERGCGADGRWPIGLLVALTVGGAAWAGLVLRLMADWADCERLRSHFADGEQDAAAGWWIGRWYVDACDPRVMVSDPFGPGWPYNVASPISWALASFAAACVVILLCGLAAGIPS